LHAALHDDLLVLRLANRKLPVRCDRSQQRSAAVVGGRRRLLLLTQSSLRSLR
jgi:hypothetical protein